MEEQHRKWEIAGLLLTLAAGTLLHFTYGWSGENPAAAPFSAVNESTWEHMKLLAVPWLAWSLAEAAATGGTALFPRALGLLAGLAAIPTAFYTLGGVFGRTHHLVNVLLFVLAAILAFFVGRRARESGRYRSRIWRVSGMALLLIAGALFFHWTFDPPDLPLFTDSVTGGPD